MLKLAVLTISLVRIFFGLLAAWQVLGLLPVFTWLSAPGQVTGAMWAFLFIKVVADHESRIARKRKSRDRFEAVRVTKDLTLANQLRDFYFSLSEDDLQAIWNNGENALPPEEKDLVRIALRNKLGITAPPSGSPEVCSQCFLPKSNCVCERGWW